MNSETRQVFSFGEFEIDPRKRLLDRAGTPISLNAKAFDLLLFLVENAGRIVTKTEIMEAVWRDQIVEDSNLTVQVSALRSALDEQPANPRFLVTIPGRGYQFTGDVSVREAFREKDPELPLSSDPSDGEEEPEARQGRVRNRSDLRISSLQLLAFAALFAVAVAVFVVSRGDFAESGTPMSVAVLPFVDRTPNGRSDYLGDGLAESVIFSLSKIPGMKVMSRDSSFRYRQQTVDYQKIGKDLGVTSVLSGSITRRDRSVEILVELVSVRDASVIWAEKISRANDDIEKLQIDVARSIVRQLQLRLSDVDEKSIEKAQTTDHEAFRHYLTGRFYLKEFTDEGFSKAKTSFLLALERDPNYALAYAGLAESHNFLSGWGAVPPNDSFPLAKAAALRALEIDDGLAEAHTQLGVVRLFYDLDPVGAEREFARAVKINPNLSDAHEYYAYVLMAQGRFEEARTSALRARELDPLSVLKLVTLGNTYWYENKPNLAIAQYRRVLEMEPQSGLGHWCLGNALMQAGRYEEAIHEFETAKRLSGDSPDEPAALAVAKAKSGNAEGAKVLLRELMERSKQGYVPATLFAFIHASLGEHDAAFDFMNKAIRDRDPLLVFLRVDPYFDPLRSDKRFAALEKHLNLR